jgi:alpha-ketoglutarate-dependent taurine dioxygenase
MSGEINLGQPIIRRKRRAVRMDSAALVNYRVLAPGKTLPMLCEPVAPGVSVTDWMREQRDSIESMLLEHGAILFRGFRVHGVDDFNACVQALSDGAVEYMFRASPRTQIDSRFHIYTSTDYPAHQKIFPHNEHAYSPVFPRLLYFYCHTAALTGGETPIGDTRSILQRIRPQVRERFMEQGIMYLRNYGDGMGLPWQTVFQTDRQEEVDAYCRGVGIQTEWKAGDRLSTRQTGPAILKHPRTGEAVWFNHATFFNALTLPPHARAGLLGNVAPEDLPQNTFYGDGSYIEAEVVQHLQEIYLDSLVQFVWEPGDVLMLDNMLTVHARNEFTGPRRIMTAMSDPQRSADLAPGDV